MSIVTQNSYNVKRLLDKIENKKYMLEKPNTQVQNNIYGLLNNLRQDGVDKDIVVRYSYDKHILYNIKTQ